MLKVVVVEDEELSRKGIILATDWASVGCVVVGDASDGEQGLEVIRRLKPDLIVTDIKMPKRNGLDMLRQLREEGSDAKVIILTAYGEFEYARAALQLGAADYLLKPFRDGELEQAVERLKKRQERGNAQYAAEACVHSVEEKRQSKYIGEVLAYVRQHYNDPEIGVPSIAAALGLSESHLGHLFKRETGYTLTGYLTHYRVHAAMSLLRDCRAKVYEVAEQVGYQDIAYFSSIFKKSTGISPSEYQKRCQA